MTSLTLTLAELGAVVLTAVGLAATDPARISRLLTAYAAQKLGVDPQEVRAMDAATDGDPATDPAEEGGA